MKIIAGRRDGLGGRLCAIINTIALCRHVKAEFQFAWRSYGTTDLSFQAIEHSSEVFSKNFRERFYIGQSIKNQDRYARIDGGNVSSSLIASTRNNMELDGIIYRNWEEPIVLDGVPGSISTRQIISAYERISFKAAISDLSQLASELVPTGVIAVHARRGDIVYGNNRIELFNEKYAPLALIKTIVEHTRSTGRQVLIFSDDARTIEIVGRMPGVITAVSLRPEIVKSALHCALFDFFLMRLCETIVSTRSGFSVAASISSGAKLYGILDYFGRAAASRDILEDLTRHKGDYSVLDAVKAQQYIATELSGVTPTPQRIQLLRAAKQSDEANSSYDQMLAVELADDGQVDEAEKILDSLANRHLLASKKDGGALAPTFHGLSRRGGFRRLARHASPNYPFITANTSYWHLTRGDYQRAVSLAQTCASAATSSLPVKIQIVRAMLAAGQSEDARRILSACSSELPDSDLIAQIQSQAAST